jgi:VWFA-related protein
MTKRQLTRTLILIALLWPSASAQNKAPTPSPQSSAIRDKIRVESDLVVLSVTVKDARGNLVSGLRQQDFHVFDDAVEQKILAFTDEGLPLSLVILVDNDMKWKQGTEMSRSLRSVAGGLSDSDEAIVCRYDVLFYPGSAFTNSAGTLIVDLKAAQNEAQPSPQYIPEPLVTDRSSTSGPPSIAAPTNAGSRPSKALDDALYSAAQLLHDRAKDRRRAILLISDGRNEPKLNHHSREAVLDLLLQENISVYALAIASNKAKRQLSGVAEYSSKTGGALFTATTTSAIEALYSHITEQARHDYTLAYAPNSNNKSSNYHTVQVITKLNLTASTRIGYFTTAPRN